MLASRQSGAVVSISLSTGGSGYTSQPSVSLSGGGGTGAVAVAHMAGTQIDSIVLTAGGTGYTSNPTVTISGGSGAGAAATAYAHTATRRPASFVRSRFNDMYVFDGAGRGLRWDGTANKMQPVGIQKPALGPVVTVANSGMAGYVDAVNIVSGGAGYSTPPTVTFTGGSATKAAKGRAEVTGGRVTGVMISEAGAGYQTAPSISFSGGNATAASFQVGVLGSVGSLAVANVGSGYTSEPTVVFSTKEGLTQANATVSVSDGKVSSVTLLSAGTGATTDVTATLSGGGGTGASLGVTMSYRVNAVTVSSGGTGQYVAPIITFTPAVSDVGASPAAATATVNSTGAVTKVTVYAGGSYSAPPTAEIADSNAKAYATLANAMQGIYKCAIRYLDNTPRTARGPIPSSISELVEVDVTAGASSLTWSFANRHVGLDDRVYAMELYRTTADQSVLLYRVATIYRTDAAWTGTYTDSLSDDQLIDTDRLDYGLLPVTLPSGQLNARRFGVPPGNYAVACMFQDRLWMAVDTSGKSPNSLMFSEIDEPESVPMENELVVQESAGDSDAVVALIPLGSALIVAQSRHLYKLQYVAQPVIDASILLAGYRGILNSQCWAVLGGVAFIADGYGMYAFDGTREDPISVPVDDFWRDGAIDFTKAHLCHVHADAMTKVVRFFYCTSANTYPVQALCYGVLSKAWWQEQYPVPMTAGAPTVVGGKQAVAYGTSTGGFVSHSGFSDSGTAITWGFRTGNMALTNEKGDRSVTLTYKPTDLDTDYRLRLHFNGSSTGRNNAIVSDRGQAGVSIQAGGVAVNTKKALSALGDSTGVARVYFSGRVDDRSAGADKHLAIAMAGTQSSSGDAPVIHSITVAGVT